VVKLAAVHTNLNEVDELRDGLFEALHQWTPIRPERSAQKSQRTSWY
jgi:hypothetical protein